MTRVEAVTPGDPNVSPISILSLSWERGRITPTFPAGASNRVWVERLEGPGRAGEAPQSCFN